MQVCKLAERGLLKLLTFLSLLTDNLTSRRGNNKMKRIDTSKITFWGLTFLLLIFVEAAFFHNGNIVFVLLGAGLIYYGLRKRSKLLVLPGLFFIAMALFTLWSLRVLIFTVIVYILVKLWKGVPSEEIMRPLKDLSGKHQMEFGKTNYFPSSHPLFHLMNGRISISKDSLVIFTSMSRIRCYQKGLL